MVDIVVTAFKQSVAYIRPYMGYVDSYIWTHVLATSTLRLPIPFFTASVMGRGL